MENCEGYVVCSDVQTREKAYNNHCSVGKYEAYEELSQYDKDLTLEDCKKMTMHEIHEQIDEHHNGHNDNEAGTHSNHHSGHH